MNGKERKKAGGSMVAPHPPIGGGLQPVEELAMDLGISAGELAGLRRATGWLSGKQVTAEQFDEAVAQFRARPMGSGGL